MGNPINPGTGDKYQIETDYQDNGKLRFTRHYHSSAIAVTGSIGSQWQHNFDSRIYSDGGTVARVIRANGKQVIYTSANGSSWVSDADINDQLIQQTGGGWQLTTANDDVETYDATGKLTSIKDRSGYTQTLFYSTVPSTGIPSVGLLVSVTDIYNHSLGFTYDSQGRVATLTDPAGGVFKYGYDTDGNLTSVTYPDATAATTDNPVRTYKYNESDYTDQTNLPHALTGIIDENNKRYATFNYDSAGRGISTEHAGGVEKYQLGYNLDSTSSQILSTDITDPLTSTYSRSFTIIQGMVKSAGQDQPAAYLGLVPVQKESGSSLKRRPQLAKNGNPAIRAKLYMAAVTATRHNPDIKAQYERLTGKGKSKMSALAAAMRKLVQICYGVIKHQKPYQPQVA